MSCQCTTKPAPRKHAELIKAWADGAKIQYKQIEQWKYKWVDALNPTWSEGIEYRIKPEPKPDLIRYTNVYSDAMSSLHLTLESMNMNAVTRGLEGQIKLTFDGETGKLKDVEIIK